MGFISVETGSFIGNFPIKSGVVVANGDLIAPDLNGQIVLADADAGVDAQGIAFFGDVLGVTTRTGVAGLTEKVSMYARGSLSGTGFIAGQPIFLSATAGGITGTSLAAQPQQVGRATSATEADIDIRPAIPNKKRIFCTFQQAPILSKLSVGGAPTGTTGDTNTMIVGGYGLNPAVAFEYHIKGTQTIVGPVQTATGLNFGMDQTASDGVEVTNGILYRANMPGCFKVGTDPAFFFRAKIKIGDASGVNPLLVGFRKAEAYQATYTAYADYAAIGVIGTSNPNVMKTTTEAAGGGNTDTSLVATWADAATKTLEVRVSAAGAVTYLIDGAADANAVAFSFTAGDNVVPFFYYLNSADVGDTVELIEWEVGLQ